MLTRGRHVDPATGGGGHAVCIIAQRHRLLDKTARDQATTLFAFVVDPVDSKALAEDWNCPTLADCHALRPLTYYHVERHQAATLGRVAIPH